MDRVLHHGQCGNIEIDTEDRAHLTVVVSNINRGGLQQLSVARTRQIAEVIVQARINRFTQPFQHDMGGTVAYLSPSDMTILYCNNGVLHRVR